MVCHQAACWAPPVCEQAHFRGPTWAFGGPVPFFFNTITSFAGDTVVSGLTRGADTMSPRWRFTTWTWVIVQTTWPSILRTQTEVVRTQTEVVMDFRQPRSHARSPHYISRQIKWFAELLYFFTPRKLIKTQMSLGSFLKSGRDLWDFMAALCNLPSCTPVWCSQQSSENLGGGKKWFQFSGVSAGPDQLRGLWVVRNESAGKSSIPTVPNCENRENNW